MTEVLERHIPEMPMEPNGQETEGNISSPEKKELEQKEKEIVELINLTQIFATMAILDDFKKEITRDVEQRGVVKAQVKMMTDAIKQGVEGRATGFEKAQNIRQALRDGRISEQDIKDRVKNIYVDLMDLEQKLKHAATEAEVSDATMPLVAKYASRDWPE